jgi:transcriptional regulator with XRE-family HTH domain
MSGVTGLVRVRFSQACVAARIGLDLTQRQVADRVGVSRSYIAKVERGAAIPDLAMVERIADALGLGLELVVTQPVFPSGPRVHDSVHARCSAYVDRRLRSAGWSTAREVEIVHGRSHGWIDLLAFDPRTGTLLVIEIKTRLDDLGALERQIGWYERMAWDAARRLGWRPRAIRAVVLALASDEVEGVIQAHRELIRLAFPVRAKGLRATVDRSGLQEGHGLALIDPSSHRRNWIIPTTIDGRRSRLPYRTYADAVRPAASSMARAPADTNEPSEPRPMNRKPISTNGGSAAAS